MNVIFVSQCTGRRAIARTRKVLDSYATRIGDNCWQTPITMEGLNKVHELLKRHASKNTSVVCYRITSLGATVAWAVGGTSDFINGQYVTNRTNVENKLYYDISEGNMNNKIYYANTKKQRLETHLAMVGLAAYAITRHNTGDDKISECALIAGALHDLGKIDYEFQNFVNKNKTEESDGVHIPGKKFGFDKHPRHNEISWMLYRNFFDSQGKRLNSYQKYCIEHCILFHHAKPLRKIDYSVFSDIASRLVMNYNRLRTVELIDEGKRIFRNVVEEITEILPQYTWINDFITNQELDEFSNTNLAAYKRYQPIADIDSIKRQIKENATNNIVRAAVISADRLISSMSKEELETLYQRVKEEGTEIIMELIPEHPEIGDRIARYHEYFEAAFPGSERNITQKAAAKELAGKGAIALLQGPAGCGKTKIATEWASLVNSKKLFWVCPRTQICEGVFTDLIEIDCWDESFKIEIYTGGRKQSHQNGETYNTPEEDYFSGDIIVTTIDQIISKITTHRNISGLTDFLHSNAVFDEFHEYFDLPGINVLFLEILESRKKTRNTRTLLVSATPNYLFTGEMAEIGDNDTVKINSFNKSKYRLHFHIYDEESEENEMFGRKPDDSIVIFNSATNAQLSFIRNSGSEKALIAHSKYTTGDRAELFEKIYRSFKKGGSKAYPILRAGPIVQASLNISCSNMYTDVTTAENWLQRLGRLNRFGEQDEADMHTYTPLSMADRGKIVSGVARHLNSSHGFWNAHEWFKKIKELKEVTIDELYEIYEDYYRDGAIFEKLKQDLVKNFIESLNLINEKILDPVQIPLKAKDDKIRISAVSLRGNSLFVNAAVMSLENGKIRFENEYAIRDDEDETMTAPLETITGNGDSRKNIITHMMKKHHNIIGGPKLRRDFEIIKMARCPDTPVYLSYVPNIKTGTVEDYCIYYLVSDDIPVGLIVYEKIKDFVVEGAADSILG